MGKRKLKEIDESCTGEAERKRRFPKQRRKSK
jgi:hypothetical protein